MYICVTHVDSVTKISCELAPMAHGPSFPDIKGFKIEFANQHEWPTDVPKFYGKCDDDADLDVSGFLNTLTEEEYYQEREKDSHIKAMHVREERNSLLRIHVDSLNPLRWSKMTPEEQEKWHDYRQQLLDVPTIEGFPWDFEWPKIPRNEDLT